MEAEPNYWKKYYCDEARQDFDKQYSLSDRIRYYWPHPAIQKAQAIMLSNLEREPVPLTLLSQYLPAHYAAIRDGRLVNTPSEILIDGVANVLHQYINACSAS
jgi:D-tagatose-1,6-bisphosphate aldolase subunit GatZ/KbaZ